MLSSQHYFKKIDLFDSGSGDLEYWLYLYSNTPMRATPFLVGMGLGYLMSQPKLLQRARMSSWQVYAGWALNTAMCLAIVFTLAIAYKEDYQDNNLEAAFYGSLHRLGWAIGISWIIFACSTGHGGNNVSENQSLNMRTVAKVTWQRAGDCKRHWHFFRR